MIMRSMETLALRMTKSAENAAAGGELFAPAS